VGENSLTVETAAITDDREKRHGREFWNSNPCGGRWKSYAAFLEWYRRTEPYMFDIVARHPWQGRRVLEVGCGQGPLVNHLPQFGASMIGVDMSDASLMRAAEGVRELGWNKRVRLLQSDAEKLPFADDAFDAVVSFGVLHHTPDTAGAIDEVRRVLKPGGLAIVMLYRTGNPKWMATRFLRVLGRLRDRRASQQTGDRSRLPHGVDDARGTALVELFGVPTLKAFSNAESRKMFREFARVDIRNCQPGFRRMADIIPNLRFAERLLAWIDRRFANSFGFYQVIEAVKAPSMRS
jgi:SAM-dependent methyltransferase